MMFELEEIESALRNESRESITQMVSMTWHHQFKARLRVPDVVDEWEGLMRRWLALSELRDAARIIQLIADHGLKDGELPQGYDPEYAERMCQALVRSRDDVEDRRMMLDWGIEQSPDLSLGQTFRF